MEIKLRCHSYGGFPKLSPDQLFNPDSISIMIVDDHDPIRKGLKRIFTKMGFKDIIECFDGTDALKVLEKRPIDIVILDLYMREMNGFEILEYIRSRDIGSDIPVIISTGEGSKDEIVKAADMGADDYLLKPFQAADAEKKIVANLNKYYSPTPLVKILRKAEREYLNNDFAMALKLFNTALELDPSSTRACHGKALTLDKSGNASGAIDLLKTSIGKNHSYHKNYASLADIYLKVNQAQDAISAMKSELEINSKQPNRQIALAKLLLKEGDAMGAVEHYRLALQEDPKRLGALMGMGHAYSMANNIEKALYYFKRVRRYHPGATKALEAAVRCALTAGDPKKAEMLLKDEKHTNPGRLDTYSVLATFYFHQDREADAFLVIDQLIQKDPENPLGLKLKGNYLIRKGDFVGALTLLMTAAKQAPSSEIFASIADALIGIKKVPEAMDALNKAITLNPENGNAFFLLANCHRYTGQYHKAVLLYKKASTLGQSPERMKADLEQAHAGISARRSPRKAS
jgi:DNA-binding response OmpR family regulator/cytochrome c-type biogenesis protein CcmH/NrfG